MYPIPFWLQVWKLYKADKLAESIDPCLKDDFPVLEVLSVLQIGLLCTQASASLRPSMAQVFEMLTCRDFEIPMPHQPPFMNGRVPNPASIARSYSINSLISNALTKIELSSVSVEDSSTHSSDVP